MEDFITVIGLEIHAELLTRTKLFCGCPAEFGGERNSRCCPVCTGMPGALPSLNRTAVEYAVRAGYALGCGINRQSAFDRKNYFYPDLPKAYQISQLYHPLVGAGSVPIEVNGQRKNVRINHIHLEEDAGKLIHDDAAGVSLADYDRCGIPLIEIVTEPDMSSAEEAMAFVSEISLLLKYAGVCDCKMEQGSLRCDVNISVMKPGDSELGTRTEIKNINSVRFVGRAIRYEERRQAELIAAGGRVVQETRRYDAGTDTTKSMRTKEDTRDYRYFPEPDILRLSLTEEQLAEIRAGLPEMPGARFDRYTGSYGLSAVDARNLIFDKAVCDLFEEVLKAYNSPKTVASFILNELMRRIKLGEVDVEKPAFTCGELAGLIRLADEEKISKNDARTVFGIMARSGGDPGAIAAAEGFMISVDMDRVSSVIDGILAANEKQVRQYVSGERKVFGFIMGQCTAALRGAATPKVIKQVLEEKLGEISAGEGTSR